MGIGSLTFGVVAVLIVIAIAAAVLAGSLETRNQPQAQQRLGWPDHVVHLGVCGTCGHDLVWIAHGPLGTYVEDATTRSPHVEHPVDAVAPFEDHPDAV